jgi:uncharacterized SAM-binding protein YcdF (DUF218 family)
LAASARDASVLATTRDAVTLPVVSILIAAAIGLSLLKWRKSSYVVLFLALALFLGIGCGPIPALLLTDLQTGYSADASVAREGRGAAIVLLGSGTERVGGANAHAVEVGSLAYGRLVKALELYQACKRLNDNCVVVVTGGDPQHHGASEAAVYGARLRQLGVSPIDITLEERSLNTWQNAQFTAPLLSARPVDRVFLVSSGIHLRRSMLYFRHFGVRAHPVRADYVSAMTSLIPVSYNFLVADLALHEYVGVLRYFVYQRMGWNVQTKQPGALPAPAVALGYLR